MKQQVYEEALKRILRMGDDLISQSAGKSREEKALLYVRHADAVETVVKQALGK